LFFPLFIEIRLFSRPTHAINNFPDTAGQTQVLDVFDQVLDPLHHVAGRVEQTSDTQVSSSREHLFALIQESAPHGTQDASRTVLVEVTDGYRQRVRRFNQCRGQCWRELVRLTFLALQDGNYNRIAGLVNLNAGVVVRDFFL